MILRQPVFGPYPAGIDGKQLELKFSAAVEANYDFTLRAFDALDRLLDQRIAGLQDRRNTVLFAVMILVSLAVCLIGAFYNGMMRTVNAIGETAKRLNQAQSADPVALESRDELGRALDSFNAMVTRLHSEYLQAKEESARARDTEARLRLSEEQYRSIFENSIAGLFQSTTQEKYRIANRSLARIYGYDSPDDLKAGMGDSSRGVYVDPNRRSEFEEIIRAQGFVANFESPVYRRDASVIWVNETAHEVRDFGGKVLYYEGTVTDISEQKRIEEARLATAEEMRRAKEFAEQSNRAKSEYLASMSHELRTPLNGILGYTQILRRNPDVTPKIADGVSVIHRSAEHLLTLINDIVDLSKIEAQRLDLALSSADLRDFLVPVNASISARAEAKGVAYQVHVAEDLPRVVKMDQIRLHQVLLNLLGYAVLFTDRGQVSLELGRGSSGKTRFLVENTGIGIPEHKIGELFKPFKQVSDAPRKSEGTGLGLALSQRLVELMGGTIEVHTEIGRGNRVFFEIDLPEV